MKILEGEMEKEFPLMILLDAASELSQHNVNSRKQPFSWESGSFSASTFPTPVFGDVQPFNFKPYDFGSDYYNAFVFARKHCTSTTCPQQNFDDYNPNQDPFKHPFEDRQLFRPINRGDCVEGTCLDPAPELYDPPVFGLD